MLLSSGKGLQADCRDLVFRRTNLRILAVAGEDIGTRLCEMHRHPENPGIDGIGDLGLDLDTAAPRGHFEGLPLGNAEGMGIHRGDLHETPRLLVQVALKKAAAMLTGTKPGEDSFAEAVEQVAALAAKQCRPMPNIPGDHDYRHAMVPVYTRRTLMAAGTGEGPVHHV